MIATYSEYIQRFVARRAKGSPPLPGEHHFVAAYLVPKLYAITGIVPDYINPDGTKAILGDVVYYRDNQHHLGIEVKLGTVRLTRGEFNGWIVGDVQEHWPHVFVGVGARGLVLSTWGEFRAAYLAAVRSKKDKTEWQPALIGEGYGPMKTVDQVAQYIPEEGRFPLSDSESAEQSEGRFISALCRYVQAQPAVAADVVSSAESVR